MSNFIQVRAAIEEFKYVEGQTDRQTWNLPISVIRPSSTLAFRVLLYT